MEKEIDLDVKYMQYEFFKVEGLGIDNSKIKLKFRKASHAFNAIKNFANGAVIGKYNGRFYTLKIK